MNGQERRIGRGALLAQRGQHDLLHGVEAREHVQQRLVEAAGRVIVGRGRELVVEAEAVEEVAQHRVVVVREALELVERIGDLRERLAEVLRQHLLVGHVVGHLAQPVHVVGEREQPRLDLAAGQRLEGVAHHGRARDFAERADMRQARGAVAGLEQNLFLAGALDARDELAGLLEGPGGGGGGGLFKRKRSGGRRRGRPCGGGHWRTLNEPRPLAREVGGTLGRRETCVNHRRRRRLRHVPGPRPGAATCAPARDRSWPSGTVCG